MSIQRRILVTGANKGIGRAICSKLLESAPDISVLLGSRDAGRGEDAISTILEAAPQFEGRVKAVQIDVANDKSVAAAAASMADEAPLFGLVNNAGIGFGYSLEETLNVNYFGPRRVTTAFLPLLDQEKGRIVNIASASGPMFVAGCGDSIRELLAGPDVTEDELAGLVETNLKYPGGGEAYGMSKAFLNAYTRILARSQPNLVVNACTPGWINTDLTKGMGATNPPEKGTLAPLHCLLEPSESLGSGKYYGSDAVRSPLDRYRGPGDPPYEGP